MSSYLRLRLAERALPLWREYISGRLNCPHPLRLIISQLIGTTQVWYTHVLGIWHSRMRGTSVRHCYRCKGNCFKHAYINWASAARPQRIGNKIIWSQTPVVKIVAMLFHGCFSSRKKTVRLPVFR